MFKTSSTFALLACLAVGCAFPTDTNKSNDNQLTSAPTLYQRPKHAGVASGSLDPMSIAWWGIETFVVDPLQGYAVDNTTKQLIDLLLPSSREDAKLAELNEKLTELLQGQKEIHDSIGNLEKQLATNQAFATAHQYQVSLVDYFGDIDGSAQASGNVGLTYFTIPHADQELLAEDMKTFVARTDPGIIRNKMSSIATVGTSNDYFMSVARYAALSAREGGSFGSMKLLHDAYMNIATRQIAALKLLSQRDQFAMHLDPKQYAADHRTFNDGEGHGDQVDFMNQMRSVGQAYLKAATALAGMLSADPQFNTVSPEGVTTAEEGIGQGLSLAAATTRALLGDSATAIGNEDQAYAQVVILSRGNDETLDNNAKYQATRFVRGSASYADGYVWNMFNVSVASSILANSGSTGLSGVPMRVDGAEQGHVKLEVSGAWRMTEVYVPITHGVVGATMTVNVDGEDHIIKLDATKDEVTPDGQTLPHTPNVHGFLDLRFAGRADLRKLNAKVDSNMYRSTWSHFGDRVVNESGFLTVSAASLAGDDATAGADQWAHLYLDVQNDVKDAVVWTAAQARAAMSTQWIDASNQWVNTCSLVGNEQRTSVTALIKFDGRDVFGQKRRFSDSNFTNRGCSKGQNFKLTIGRTPLDGVSMNSRQGDLAVQVRTADWSVSQSSGVDIQRGTRELVLDAGYNNIIERQGQDERFIDSSVTLGSFNVYVSGDGY